MGISTVTSREKKITDEKSVRGETGTRTSEVWCVPLAAETRHRHTHQPSVNCRSPEFLPFSPLPPPLPNFNCCGLKNVISVGGAFSVSLFNDSLVSQVQPVFPSPPSVLFFCSSRCLHPPVVGEPTPSHPLRGLLQCQGNLKTETSLPPTLSEIHAFYHFLAPQAVRRFCVPQFPRALQTTSPMCSYPVQNSLRMFSDGFSSPWVSRQRQFSD